MGGGYQFLAREQQKTSLRFLVEEREMELGGAELSLSGLCSEIIMATVTPSREERCSS